ncbi:MAG TPA: DUF302 domain-containing protein [Acidobacteriota bacterium]|nr:DUF302 domain-containing protein [Acidobacteriota bacterium]
MESNHFTFYKDLPGVSFQQAIERVKSALEKEGFGVLTEIDVQATLKKKLGIDFKTYVILGACNPQLAHKVLSTNDGVGLLLPCNVVVAEKPGGSEVGILRPDAMFQLVDDPQVRPIAEEAQERLQRVHQALSD